MQSYSNIYCWTRFGNEGEHVHEPKFGKPEARKVIAEIKTRSEQLTPSVAVRGLILPMTNDYDTQLSLPSKGSLIQMSRRKRRENNLVEEKNSINRQFTLTESFCDFQKNRERSTVTSVRKSKR